ncbi:non-ribosomal peptide synthetase [Streptomyces sp. NPDC001142]
MSTETDARARADVSRTAPARIPGVLTQICAIAKANPEAIAVRCGNRATTYRALVTAADRVVRELRSRGVGPGDRVGILTAPCPEMLCAVVGILAAGAAYVPLNPAATADHIQRTANDAGLCLVLTDKQLSRRRIGLDREALAAIEPIEGDGYPETPRPGDWVDPTSEDVAYVMYTSGSTGAPKGVVVTHGNLAFSTWARREVYPGPATFLLVSPLAFDSSAAGIWGTLTSGGCVAVADELERHDPRALVEAIVRWHVTRTLMIPSLYRLVLESWQQEGSAALSTLESVTVAGESLPTSLIAKHFNALPQVRLVNEYGPTEGTVWATFKPYTSPGPTSIGGAIPGMRVEVLDEQLRRVAPGERGELCIAGPGVALGYLGNPEATAVAFVTDPWSVDGGRLYRTGDLARMGPDGDVEYLGRRDRQVKVRGQRVELEAVEGALEALPGIADAAVEADDSRASLTAHLVLERGSDAAEVRACIDAALSNELRPGRVHLHDRFPITPNGKKDIAALRRAVAGDTAADGAHGPAHPDSDDLRATVRQAWREVLGVKVVPADKNFFDLGGQSMAVMELQAALERLTGVHTSVVSLFRHTTVEAQTALVERGGEDDEASRLRRTRSAHAGRQRRERVRGKIK